MRVVHEGSAPLVFDGLSRALSELAARDGECTITTALGALWRLVRDVGFSPSINQCAECHTGIPVDTELFFSHLGGGVLCIRCGARSPGGRRLPATARDALAGWLSDNDPELTILDARAHQRLLREFMGHHLSDGRPLRAFAVWESGGLDMQQPA